jgi:hypothetical protein
MEQKVIVWSVVAVLGVAALGALGYLIYILLKSNIKKEKDGLKLLDEKELLSVSENMFTLVGKDNKIEKATMAELSKLTQNLPLYHTMEEIKAEVDFTKPDDLSKWLKDHQILAAVLRDSIEAFKKIAEDTNSKDIDQAKIVKILPLNDAANQQKFFSDKLKVAANDKVSFMVFAEILRMGFIHDVRKAFYSIAGKDMKLSKDELAKAFVWVEKKDIDTDFPNGNVNIGELMQHVAKNAAKLEILDTVESVAETDHWKEYITFAVQMAVLGNNTDLENEVKKIADLRNEDLKKMDKMKLKDLAEKIYEKFGKIGEVKK